MSFPLQLLLSEFYPGQEHPPSFHPLGQIWYPLPQQLAQLHANEIVYVLYDLGAGPPAEPDWTTMYYKAQVNRSQKGVPRGFKSFTYLHADGTKQIANVPMHAWLPGETKPFPTCIQVGQRTAHTRTPLMPAGGGARAPAMLAVTQLVRTMLLCPLIFDVRRRTLSQRRTCSDLWRRLTRRPRRLSSHLPPLPPRPPLP